MTQHTPSAPDCQPTGGWLFVPSRREARQLARELEADAERFDGRLPEVAADRRAEAGRMRNLARNFAPHLPAGTRVLRGEDGEQVVGEDGRLRRLESAKKTRERMRLVAELERFSRLPEPEQRAYESRARVESRRACLTTWRSGFAVWSRRTPTARPVARRPAAKRTTSASRDGPDDGDGEPGPPAGAPAAGEVVPRPAWRADTWVRWRCCPKCAAPLHWWAFALRCPREDCPLGGRPVS